MYPAVAEQIEMNEVHQEPSLQEQAIEMGLEAIIGDEALINRVIQLKFLQEKTLDTD
jgi:hypothetical protein